MATQPKLQADQARTLSLIELKIKQLETALIGMSHDTDHPRISYQIELAIAALTAARSALLKGERELRDLARNIKVVEGIL